MEINTEINKVFGQEMAKLFATSVSKEEMEDKAREIWRNLTAPNYNYGKTTNSELEEYIRKEFLNELHEEIKKILAEPDNKEELEKRAREMVAEARRVGEEAIIKSMAEHLVSSALSAYNVHDKFVCDVMEAMRLQAQPQWR